MKISKDIIENLYFEKNLTVREISKIYGKSGPTISYYFKKFGIKTNRAIKNEINIDKSILEDMYINKDLKSEEIAKSLGISIPTVLRNLHRYKIEIKGIKHYNTLPKIQFTQEQYEFFDGLMISDGSLVRRKLNYGSGASNAKISCGFKYKEFAEYINNFLKLDGNIHKKIHKSDRYKSGQCIQYGLMSSDNILFTEEKQRWYPDVKKIIPSDFRFSPISMNIMYLGDGSLHKRDKYIILCTNSFGEQNINDVILKKLQNINIECWVVKNNIIRISKQSTQAFLNYIGQCPVKCYEYKWDT